MVYSTYTIDRRHYTSAANGRRGSGNRNPDQSGLQNRPNMPRGKARKGTRQFLELAAEQGMIMEDGTPILDFVRSVALNPDMRADLRLGASAIAVKYESHSKAPKPYAPKLPVGFKLPRLTSVAACQEALAIITESVLDTTLTPDAADYLRRHVDSVLPSLIQTETQAEIAALKEFIDQVEAKVITGTIEPHTPEPQEPEHESPTRPE